MGRNNKLHPLERALHSLQNFLRQGQNVHVSFKKNGQKSTRKG